jgi:hypothetical protein
MTQEEFDKSPLLDQILYDCTGMLAENHPSIVEAMQKYADAQLLKTAVVGQSEQFNCDGCRWFNSCGLRIDYNNVRCEEFDNN